MKSNHLIAGFQNQSRRIKVMRSLTMFIDYLGYETKFEYANKVNAIKPNLTASNERQRAIEHLRVLPIH